MRSVLLLLFASLSLSAVYAQDVTPIRFKTKSNKNSNDALESPTYKAHLDSLTKLVDTTTKQEGAKEQTAYERKREVFNNLAVRFEQIAKEREAAITKDFANRRSAAAEDANKPGLSLRDIDDINEKLDELDELEKEHLEVVSKLMDAHKAMNYKYRNLRSLKTFPVKNSVDAQLYYEYYLKEKRNKFLTNSLISLNPQAGKVSIFNELYSDYFGPVRFGVGALISNKETKTTDDNGETKVDSASLQEDALQRLLGGGGNLGANFGIPVLGYLSSREEFAFKLIANTRLSVDVPSLGTESSDYAVNFNPSLEGDIFYTGILDVLTLYSSFKFGYVMGNDKFYQYLRNYEQKPFGLHQFSVGLAINSTFRVSWNHYWGSDFVKGAFPSTISFSVIPNK